MILDWSDKDYFTAFALRQLNSNRNNSSYYSQINARLFKIYLMKSMCIHLLP
jgi:hypothetical protein